MKNTKEKKGISLIVLVLTIIIMIILATAIILSLSNSGIIGKADKAKQANDAATEKEAVSLILAEYELAVKTGEIDPSVKTAKAYVEELAKSGITLNNVLITEEGNLVVGPAAFFIKNNIPEGTVVNGYTLTDKSYTTDGNELKGYGLYNSITTYDAAPQTLKTNTSLTWKYVGIDEEGNALILADMPITEDSNSKIQLGYDGGYKHGIDVLNTVCDNLYSTSKGKARNINLDDVVDILEYTGKMGFYINERVHPSEVVEFDNRLTADKFIKLYASGYDDYGFWGDWHSKELSWPHSDFIGYPRITTSSNINSLKSIIFSSATYWLSSCYLYVIENGSHESDDSTYFTCWEQYCINTVENSGISGATMLDPDRADYSDAPSTNYIRPIVELDENVICSYSNGVVTLN